MTLDEARQILGIPEDADARSLRRAYLRRVKQHSPERDPEGFMRVRQAFELAESCAEGAAAEWQHELGDTPSSPAAVLPDVARPEAAARSAHAPDTVAAERAREAQAFRTRLVEAESAWDEDEVRAILREALARGHAEFALDARQTSPELLSDTQLSDWLDEQLDRPNATWANLAGTLLERGRVQDALRTGLARLAAQHGGPDLDPTLVLGEQLDLQGTTFTLELFARGLDVEAARFGDEYLTVRDPLARADPLRFEALRQLLTSHARLPRDVVRAIAVAVRDHQPSLADDTLADFCTAERKLARAAQQTLEREAPLLSKLFGAALSPRSAVPWRRGRFSPPAWVYTVALVGLMNLARVAFPDRPKPAPVPVRRESELERAAYEAELDRCATTPAPICEVAVCFAQAEDCGAMLRCAQKADAESTRARRDTASDRRVQTIAKYILKETRAQCGASVDKQR